MRRFREGSGRICLDYIRTLRHRDSPAEVEELADPVALAAWVTQFGPWDRVTATSDVRAVESARTLREAIFRVVDLARTTKGPVHPSDRDRIVINKAAGREVPIPSLDKRGEVQWTAPDPIAAVLATVARDALELVTSPTAARIRRCEGESCHAYFVDLSRPGSRRWCSMDTCGNRAKKRNLRAREMSAY